jgi:YfiH family protein
VRIICSDRRGGVSRPPFDSCNVGDHVGDDPDAVARNRAAIAAAAALPDPRTWVWIDQVHGRDVVEATGPSGGRNESADATVTAVPALPVAVVTADCAPVVLANDDAAGIVHAGHRGLAVGVIEAAVERLRAIGGGRVRAFLGPCIRAECYEFGPDDLAALVARFGTAVEGRTRAGRPALDLPAGVRVALAGAGVHDLDDCGVCTFDDPHAFSYRRDGTTGRQVTVAVLT